MSSLTRLGKPLRILRGSARICHRIRPFLRQGLRQTLPGHERLQRNPYGSLADLPGSVAGSAYCWDKVYAKRLLDMHACNEPLNDPSRIRPDPLWILHFCTGSVRIRHRIRALL